MFKKSYSQAINLYLIIKFLLFLEIILFIISIKLLINYFINIKKIELKKKFHSLFLYKEDKKVLLNNKNLINICMALDNNIIYPTLVSMISALENNKKNILAYNLLLSDDFKK
jgi:hypothetical protein